MGRPEKRKFTIVENDKPFEQQKKIFIQQFGPWNETRPLERPEKRKFIIIDHGC